MKRLLLLLLPFACALSCAAATTTKPNIVLIYADDLGYGDVSCYGATNVQTPHTDRLAKEGLRFTGAYSSSATCTPSRFSMLTGQYAFRQKGTGVLRGDAPLIIKPGRITLATILKKAGYTTAVVGKWHLGLGEGTNGLDWNKEIAPGPLEIGFDYSFIMPATGDRVPCVYVENRKVVGLDPADPIEVSYTDPFPGLPTGTNNRASLRMDWSHGHNHAVVNGVGRIGFMKGGTAALWKDEEMADVFARQAVKFIETNRRRPFFLYFSTHSIHVPRIVGPRFAGKSGMGLRGDAILEFDWQVGQILDALDRFKLSENTLVILSSDNGPVIDDGYKDEAREKLGSHKPAGPLRGGKYSLFEGGTRVPFIVRWPARVKPGTSSALISQVDFPATFAALTGQKLTSHDAPDSQDVLPALLGDSKSGRDHIIEHAAGRLAIRVGDWKYILGGQGASRSANTNTELGNDPGDQLYNLANDPGETKNVSAAHPERLKELAATLAQMRTSPSR